MRPDQPQAAPQEPTEQKTAIRGSDVTAVLFGVPIFAVIIGCGVLNILAAKGGWNPFHWQGRFWTGILLIAAPSVLVIMATLPAAAREKIPPAAVGWVTLLVWIAFVWAACGGH